MAESDSILSSFVNLFHTHSKDHDPTTSQNKDTAVQSLSQQGNTKQSSSDTQNKSALHESPQTSPYHGLSSTLFKQGATFDGTDSTLDSSSAPPLSSSETRRTTIPGSLSRTASQASASKGTELTLGKLFSESRNGSVPGSPNPTGLHATQSPYLSNRRGNSSSLNDNDGHTSRTSVIGLGLATEVAQGSDYSAPSSRKYDASQILGSTKLRDFERRNNLEERENFFTKEPVSTPSIYNVDYFNKIDHSRELDGKEGFDEELKDEEFDDEEYEEGKENLENYKQDFELDPTQISYYGPGFNHTVRDCDGSEFYRDSTLILDPDTLEIMEFSRMKLTDESAEGPIDEPIKDSIEEPEIYYRETYVDLGQDEYPEPVRRTAPRDSEQNQRRIAPRDSEQYQRRSMPPPSSNRSKDDERGKRVTWYGMELPAKQKKKSKAKSILGIGFGYKEYKKAVIAQLNAENAAIPPPAPGFQPRSSGSGGNPSVLTAREALSGQGFQPQSLDAGRDPSLRSPRQAPSQGLQPTRSQERIRGSPSLSNSIDNRRYSQASYVDSYNDVNRRGSQMRDVDSYNNVNRRNSQVVGGDSYANVNRRNSQLSNVDNYNNVNRRGSQLSNVDNDVRRNSQMSNIDNNVRRNSQMSNIDNNMSNVDNDVRRNNQMSNVGNDVRRNSQMSNAGNDVRRNSQMTEIKYSKDGNHILSRGNPDPSPQKYQGHYLTHNTNFSMKNLRVPKFMKKATTSIPPNLARPVMPPRTTKRPNIIGKPTVGDSTDSSSVPAPPPLASSRAPPTDTSAGLPTANSPRVESAVPAREPSVRASSVRAPSIRNHDVNVGVEQPEDEWYSLGVQADYERKSEYEPSIAHSIRGNNDMPSIDAGEHAIYRTESYAPGEEEERKFYAPGEEEERKFYAPGEEEESSKQVDDETESIFAPGDTYIIRDRSKSLDAISLGNQVDYETGSTYALSLGADAGGKEKNLLNDTGFVHSPTYGYNVAETFNPTEQDESDSFYDHANMTYQVEKEEPDEVDGEFLNEDEDEDEDPSGGTARVAAALRAIYPDEDEIYEDLDNNASATAAVAYYSEDFASYPYQTQATLTSTENPELTSVPSSERGFITDKATTTNNSGEVSSHGSFTRRSSGVAAQETKEAGTATEEDTGLISSTTAAFSAASAAVAHGAASTADKIWNVLMGESENDLEEYSKGLEEENIEGKDLSDDHIYDRNLDEEYIEENEFENDYNEDTNQVEEFYLDGTRASHVETPLNDTPRIETPSSRSLGEFKKTESPSLLLTPSRSVRSLGDSGGILGRDELETTSLAGMSDVAGLHTPVAGLHTPVAGSTGSFRERTTRLESDNNSFADDAELYIPNQKSVRSLKRRALATDSENNTIADVPKLFLTPTGSVRSLGDRGSIIGRDEWDTNSLSGAPGVVALHTPAPASVRSFKEGGFVVEEVTEEVMVRRPLEPIPESNAQERSKKPGKRAKVMQFASSSAAIYARNQPENRERYLRIKEHDVHHPHPPKVQHRLTLNEEAIRQPTVPTVHHHFSRSDHHVDLSVPRVHHHLVLTEDDLNQLTVPQHRHVFILEDHDVKRPEPNVMVQPILILGEDHVKRPDPRQHKHPVIRQTNKGEMFFLNELNHTRPVIPKHPVQGRDINMPKINMPKVKMPKMKKISMPKVHMPKLKRKKDVVVKSTAVEAAVSTGVAGAATTGAATVETADATARAINTEVDGPNIHVAQTSTIVPVAVEPAEPVELVEDSEVHELPVVAPLAPMSIEETRSKAETMSRHSVLPTPPEEEQDPILVNPVMVHVEDPDNELASEHSRFLVAETARPEDRELEASVKEVVVLPLDADGEAPLRSEAMTFEVQKGAIEQPEHGLSPLDGEDFEDKGENGHVTIEKVTVLTSELPDHHATEDFYETRTNEPVHSYFDDTRSLDSSLYKTRTVDSYPYKSHVDEPSIPYLDETRSPDSRLRKSRSIDSYSNESRMGDSHVEYLDEPRSPDSRLHGTRSVDSYSYESRVDEPAAAYLNQTRSPDSDSRLHETHTPKSHLDDSSSVGEEIHVEPIPISRKPSNDYDLGIDLSDCELEYAIRTTGYTPQTKTIYDNMKFDSSARASAPPASTPYMDKEVGVDSPSLASVPSRLNDEARMQSQSSIVSSPSYLEDEEKVRSPLSIASAPSHMHEEIRSFSSVPSSVPFVVSAPMIQESVASRHEQPMTEYEERKSLSVSNMTTPSMSGSEEFFDVADAGYDENLNQQNLDKVDVISIERDLTPEPIKTPTMPIRELPPVPAPEIYETPATLPIPKMPTPTFNPSPLTAALAEEEEEERRAHAEASAPKEEVLYAKTTTITKEYD
ncbi:hypothetical protein BGZ46_007118 [Entomortierella lignicola]|nr:hypothetical protein BGZ46_007118 [Entomortierella lignicola]